MVKEMSDGPVQHEPQRLWFRAKRFGWGWTPATKEGWLVLFVYIILFVLGEVLFIRRPAETQSAAAMVPFLIYVAVITGVLLWISWKKGEKPRWRWGK